MSFVLALEEVVKMTNSMIDVFERSDPKIELEYNEGTVESYGAMYFVQQLEVNVGKYTPVRKFYHHPPTATEEQRIKAKEMIYLDCLQMIVTHAFYGGGLNMIQLQEHLKTQHDRKVKGRLQE